jgi:neutral ceramidase
MTTPTHQRLEFGFGRADMSAFEPEMLMFGWGVRTNKARGVHTPLHARAVVVRDPTTGVATAFVAIEALLVAQGLWYGVLDALAASPPRSPSGDALTFTADNVVIVATHTHSGPSGYGHHFWESFNAPGFSPVVFAAIRDAVVTAISDAARALTPGDLVLAVGRVPLSEGAAFNRSWFAYNRNRDVTPVTRERRDEATDRITTVLRFHHPDGRLAGLMHWFASHGTTIHADNHTLHPDHKGLVALALESEGLGVVCAQESCGDVSPNYRWDDRRRHTVGRFEDDLASSQHVADAQLREIKRLLQIPGTRLSPTLSVATRFIDLATAEASARFTFDGRNRTTCPAQLGISMAQGTAEGPGPLRFIRWLPRGMNALAGLTERARAFVTRSPPDFDPKFPFIEISRGHSGKLLGALPIKLAPPFDPIFAWVGEAIKKGGSHDGSWVPQVVPLNLIKLGELVIAACPFEMTTVSGRRTRAAIQDAFPRDAVSHVVMSPYANAYIGYLTTFEEYQVQHYEAGYTLFGPHSLAALQTAFHDLATRLQAGTPRYDAPPPRLTTTHLERIRFSTPWTA